MLMPSHTPPHHPLQFYTTNGYLFPKARPFYWIGMRINSTSEPRNFSWVDPSLPVGFVFEPGSSYSHWGTAQGQAEPNNFYFPPEMCVGANFSQAYDDAAGWADANCGMRYPIMCKLARGSLRVPCMHACALATCALRLLPA
jgi:hypothetical protein